MFCRCLFFEPSNVSLDEGCLLTGVRQTVNIVHEQCACAILAGRWFAELVKHPPSGGSTKAGAAILDRKNWIRESQKVMITHKSIERLSNAFLVFKHTRWWASATNFVLRNVFKLSESYPTLRTFLYHLKHFEYLFLLPVPANKNRWWNLPLLKLHLLEQI